MTLLIQLLLQPCRQRSDETFVLRFHGDSNICVSVCLMLLSRCEDYWTFVAAVVSLSS
jgi:hypothetical protein